MRPVLGPENVARMAVAVQADLPGRGYDREGAFHGGEGLLGDRFPGFEQVRWDEIVFEKVGSRLVAERFRVEGRAQLERTRGTQRVNAADEAPDPFERLGIVEVRRAAAAARIHSKKKAAVFPRVYRRNHRDLALGELARKGVL